MTLRREPVLLAVSSAAPDTTIGQTELFDGFYSQLYSGVPHARRLFIDSTRVQRRHFYWDPRRAYSDGFPPTGALMDAWEQGALELGRRVVPAVLAGHDPATVGTFIMVSTTGYTCPGPEVRLAAELGLRSDIRRISIGHMGCYAAITGLRTALDALAARPDELVLVVCTELTSMHCQPDAISEQIIVQGLFGDASAAMLLGTRPADRPVGHPTTDHPSAGAPACGVSADVVATRTVTHPGTAEHMRIRVQEDGFRLCMSPAVPAMLGSTTPPFVDQLLEGSGLGVADVRHWAIHPGGPRIVAEVGAALGLSEAQLRPSMEVLRDYGNCSSATVLLVLQRMLALDRPEAGDHAVLIAFGPGLTTEAALLRF
ncbi:type III polyketide synthase [Frankia sp. Cas3]|uniref:type III polyketide synthase n=1 Tax=Frankia sp. Cas3 TaxID=3073926 RepID=UPI002AD2D6DC|nr:type III polyketide synthase [Frankia sp. Cas3]